MIKNVTVSVWTDLQTFFKSVIISVKRYGKRYLQTTEDVFPIPGDFFFFKYITVFKEVCELLILFQEILSEKQNLPLCEDSGILIYIHQINSPSKIFRRLSEALILVAEVVIRRCSVKKVFLEISHKSQENTCAKVSSLIKLQASGRVFLWILQNS